MSVLTRKGATRAPAAPTGPQRRVIAVGRGPGQQVVARELVQRPRRAPALEVAGAGDEALAHPTPPPPPPIAVGVYSAPALKVEV